MKYFYTYCRFLLLFLWLCCFGGTANATHIRAGEITVKRTSTQTLSYKIRLTVYTDSLSPIDDIDNRIFFGDGTSEVRPRLGPRVPIVGKGTWVSVYEYDHTYSAIGSYLIYYVGENRNVDVKNMSNSSSTQFYVETRITIDPFLGINNSPVLTNPAIDLAGLGQVFSHNPAAFDPDGDSLSFENVASMQNYNPATQQGIPVNDYTNPAVRAGGTNEAQNAAATMIVNAVTGELRWDAPQLLGYFNTAIRITEWRRGRAIGYVIRDIQIIVRDTRNFRPRLIIPQDTCIVAGTTLNRIIRGNDVTTPDRVILSSYGGVYNLTSPLINATFQTPATPSNPIAGTFNWATNCQHVRKQPYDVTFKAEDIPIFAPQLATLQTWRITVVAPAPKLLSATALENNITLTWENYLCANAEKIAIYRKIDSSNWDATRCNIGLPPPSGFVKIGEVSRNTLSFIDNNAGAGLKRGINYCYRVVAIFPAPLGGESYASNEMCASLALDAPLITKVSVLETAENGKMQVEWTQPLELDKIQFPAPYRYRLFRAESIGGTNFTQVYETNTLTDTTFTDVVDTRNKEYTYKLAFYSGASAQLRDSADAASSVQLIPEASVGQVQLRWTANVPWSNVGYQHYIFRKVNGSFALIDSVLSTESLVNYTDNGTYLGLPLEPSVIYTYKVRTQGKYTSDRMPKILFNDSYEVLAIPRDTVAPCPPVLSLDSTNCGNTCATLTPPNSYNTLSWIPQKSAPCDSVIRQYKVYFTPYEGDSMQLLATTTDTFFVHNNLNSLAGCYYVTALDAFGNESKPSNIQCKDNCVALEFPNVFTVNGDAKNQIFRPICITPSYIKSIRLSIYNRWGKKIHDIDDKENLLWDGTIKGKPAATGTYFYLAEVEFIRLRRGQERQNYKGWLDLLR